MWVGRREVKREREHVGWNGEGKELRVEEGGEVGGKV
jgi:hypothetical protein